MNPIIPLMRRPTPFPVLQPPIPYRSTWYGVLARGVALAAALAFALALVTGSVDGPVVVGGVLVLTFLAAVPTGRAGSLAPLDVLMAVLAAWALVYRPEAIARLASGAPTTTDLLAAAAFLLAIAEATRRVAGWPALLGVVAWAAALLFRDRLPEVVRGAPVDPVDFATRLFYGPDGLLGTSFALVVEWLLPIVFFAGTLHGARLAPLLAGLLRPFGVAPAAAALVAPFLIEPDLRAGSGAGPTLRALFPLTPPALGFSALLVGQALGSVEEVGGRLLAPAALALAIIVLRSRPKQWQRVQPLSTLRPPAVDLPTVGNAAVLAAPLATLVGLFMLPPLASFGLGTGIAMTGALIARPSWPTARALVGGWIWAARQAPLAGSVLLLFVLVERLEGTSGLLAAVSAPWLGLAPFWFVALALVAGALLSPPVAIGVVMLVSGNAVPDPAGAFVAALFWTGAAHIVAGRPKARAFFGRVVWALPLVLVALVATRAAFEERGYAAPLVLIAESAAALVVGVALLSVFQLGLTVRAMLLLLGVFLLNPGPEVAVALVVGLVVLVLIASATGRPAALDARRWRASKFASRLRAPRLRRRPQR